MPIFPKPEGINSDIWEDLRRGGQHRRRVKKHKPRPCGNPPAVPNNVVMNFLATEARTHLRFTGKILWTEVTTDEQGHDTKIKRYDIQYRATDAAGVPIETEDGVVRRRTHVKPPPLTRDLRAATNPSGSIFQFVTRGKHGLAAGEIVRVAGCKSPATYNSPAGNPYTITVVNDDYTFRVNGGSSGVADCEKPGRIIEAEENDTRLHVITRALPRPKTWYWQARVRAVDKDDCAGDWSAWTAPGLPWTGANPQPPAPTGLQLDFDKHERARHARWQWKLRWNEVQNFDYPGTPADDEEDVSRYHWQIQVSKDQTVGDDEIYREGSTKEAQDEDDNDIVRVRGKVRNKKWWFRARVRSIDRFNRRGPYTAWGSWQRPGDELPPRPTNVTIFEGSADRVVLEWDAPTDPDDGDLIHVDIAYFQVQISKQIGFGTPYRFDRMDPNERKAFKIHNDDVNDIFYGRVRSVNSDGEKSAWIPATIGGNDDPGTTPDGVIVAGQGTVYVATFTKPGVVLEKHYDTLWVAPRRLKFKKARARVGRHDGSTHPMDGTPQGGSCQVNIWVHSADETSALKIFDTDDRLKIDAHTHKDTQWLVSFNITHIEENESLSIKVPQANGANNLVVQVLMEPA